MCVCLCVCMCVSAVRVADGVAVIMRAVAESGTAAAAPMREASLREGAMLHHLVSTQDMHISAAQLFQAGL